MMSNEIEEARRAYLESPRALRLVGRHEDDIHRYGFREGWNAGAADLSARLAASSARVRELEAALENIHLNVKGLTDGMVPTMSRDALWYFTMIEGVCARALRGAEAREEA
jgi:hypothetical protein